MFVKLENGVPVEFPYTVDKLRRDNSNVSFPESIPNSILEEFGVFTVSIEAEPPADKRVKNVTRDALPTLEGSVWVLKWTISDKTADEISDYNALIADENRDERNSILAATDWWAVQDRTMSQAEIDYRQELRDITSHANWPHLIDNDWPTQP
jgi:hypothetical protein